MSTHYQILDLAFRDGKLDPTVLKKSYHKALLKNHPDKQTSIGSGNNGGLFTVDEINWAYACLSDASLKKKYDEALKLGQPLAESDKSSMNVAMTQFKTGLDVVDLEDMDYEKGKYTKSCRCGEEKGYVISESDMDELEDELAMDDKTLSGSRAMILGCLGCSLWLKVEWFVVEDDN